MTRYNTIFLRLSSLKAGDPILLKFNGVQYQYRVTRKAEVWPYEVESLLNINDSDQLVLQTCTPIGTDLKRLL